LSGDLVIEIDLQTQGAMIDTFIFTGNHGTGEMEVSSIVLEGNNVNSWTSPEFSLTLDEADGIDRSENYGFKTFATKNYRYWRITISNTGNDFTEISNIFLGNAVQFPYNGISLGWEFTRIDNSSITVGRYFQKYIDVLTQQKKITGNIELMNKEEMGDWLTMIDYAGITKPIWLIIDDSLDETNIAENKYWFVGYFYFQERPAIQNPFYQLYNTSFNLLETI
jgi:hypothetical protein